MANVPEFSRAGGKAYEARWRADQKFRQRTFTVKRDAERFALKVENDIAEGATTAPLVRRGHLRQRADTLFLAKPVDAWPRKLGDTS